MASAERVPSAIKIQASLTADIAPKARQTTNSMEALESSVADLTRLLEAGGPADAGRIAEVQQRFDAACAAVAARLGAAHGEPPAAGGGAELDGLVERREQLERSVARKDDELRRLARALQTFRVHMGMLQAASEQHAPGR